MAKLIPAAHPYKPETTANPISPNVFCADPTGVEYEGRLYVYGTNDHQQYEAVGDDGKNSYEQIKSLVCFSTADMVNWEYHGLIRTAEIAPWIVNSWAPSVISRVESDGLTHFYLYFSNSGCGVGVLTATHPLGPWSDPLGKPLIWQDMPGLENCPAPFDPGACIDESGVGWLTFGGGTAAQGGQIHTQTAKIVRLGRDLLSFDSEFVTIDAPYFFEASELNCVDGTYIYTYSTDWQPRTGWQHPSVPAPGICAMGCMTTRTPLDGASWVFRGGFFLNAGEAGMDWCNNHTHIMPYKGKRYILHHTMHIQERMATRGGFRCMCVDELPGMAETLPVTKATREGVKQLSPLDPFIPHGGAEMCTCAGLWYEEVRPGKMAVRAAERGAWLYIRGVDFGAGAAGIRLDASGTGRVEIRLDARDAEPAAALTLPETAAAFPQPITGVHDVYIVMENENAILREWSVYP